MVPKLEDEIRAMYVSLLFRMLGCILTLRHGSYAQFYPGNDPLSGPDVGHIVSDLHFERLKGMLETTKGYVHLFCGVEWC